VVTINKFEEDNQHRNMGKKQWYELLFENYSRKYDNENFTQGTIGECDFIENELSYNKSLKILDVGCGTGQHSTGSSRYITLWKNFVLQNQQKEMRHTEVTLLT
jgi:ubiquinone/menaquinone biosynthesis C-methylase UbiE